MSESKITSGRCRLAAMTLLLGVGVTATAGAQQTTGGVSGAQRDTTMRCPPGYTMRTTMSSSGDVSMGASGATSASGAARDSANNSATNPDQRLTGLNRTNGANGTGDQPSTAADSARRAATAAANGGASGGVSATGDATTAATAAIPAGCVRTTGSLSPSGSTNQTSNGDVELSPSTSNAASSSSSTPMSSGSSASSSSPSASDASTSSAASSSAMPERARSERRIRVAKD